MRNLIIATCEGLIWLTRAIAWLICSPFRLGSNYYRSLSRQNRLIFIIMICIIIQTGYGLFDVVRIKIKNEMLIRMNKFLTDVMYMNDPDRSKYADFFDKEDQVGYGGELTEKEKELDNGYKKTLRNKAIRK